MLVWLQLTSTKNDEKSHRKPRCTSKPPFLDYFSWSSQQQPYDLYICDDDFTLIYVKSVPDASYLHKCFSLTSLHGQCQIKHLSACVSSYFKWTRDNYTVIFANGLYCSAIKYGQNLLKSFHMKDRCKENQAIRSYIILLDLSQSSRQ